MDEDRILDRLGDALMPEHREPSADRVAQLRRAVEDSRAERARPDPVAPRRGWSLRGFGLSAATFAAGALVAAMALNALRAPTGEVEFAGTVTTDGGSVIQASVRETGIGRVIRLDSDFLPILPKGEFYEVWFVGPGDAPDDPNRISAGTFHPDPEGQVEVQFAAAVDPSLYSTLSITVERGDGNPAPGDEEILRASLAGS